MLVFSSAEALAESLDAEPNIWGTAVRKGAEAGRRARAKRKLPQREPGGQEEHPASPSRPRAPVAVLLMRPGDAGAGEMPEDHPGAKLVNGLLRKWTGLEVFSLAGLPGSAGWEQLPGPVGLLVMTSALAGAALAELAAQATGLPDSPGRLQEGCVMALLDLPLEGLLSVHADGPTYVIFGFEKDKNNKDVLSLRRWEMLQESVGEQPGKTLLGLGMPPSGCVVLYPDGCAEALQTPVVRLRAGPLMVEEKKSWELMEEDENAHNLPQGFAPHCSPYTVVAGWVAEGGVLAFTGAGISKESGVPTFRDGDGLWERYDAMEVSSIGGLAGEPARVWAFEREFNDILRGCLGPNAGHRALAELEALGCVDLVVTQNVDGFQQAAGSKEVLELHGSEVHAVCLHKGCGHRVEMQQIFECDDATGGGLWSPLAKGWGVRWPESAEETPLQKAVRQQLGALQRRRPPKKKKKKAKEEGGDAGADGQSNDSSSSSSSPSSCCSSSSSSASASKGKAGGKEKAKLHEAIITKSCAAKGLSQEELEKGPPECRVPICPACRTGVLKPDGIFFGEPLARPVLERSVRQSARARVVVMVGTSGQVDPAAKLPLIAKRKNRAKIVEINTAETRLSKHADIRLRGTAATVLPKLQRLVSAHRRTAELRAQRAAKGGGSG